VTQKIGIAVPRELDGCSSSTGSRLGVHVNCRTQARLWGVIHRDGRKSRQISGMDVIRQGEVVCPRVHEAVILERRLRLG
jgi:hypothetical protein